MAPPRRTYEEIVAKYELEVQIEANALKKSIGVVAQPGQILTAVYYLDHIGQGDKRVLQDAAFGAVVHQDRKSMNFDRVWREICFCRAIGEPAAYFVAINSKDQEVMEELHILAQHWGLLVSKFPAHSFLCPDTSRVLMPLWLSQNSRDIQNRHWNS
jgi:uncharacterized protein with von Willebrand factor type A (vWA) domain